MGFAKDILQEKGYCLKIDRCIENGGISDGYKRTDQ